MHIFFSGIGGTAIGPLALIAKQAGYTVSGSDKQGSQYINYLKKHGVGGIHIGQEYDQIKSSHEKNPIDWYVYSSAVAIENPDAPELKFCQEQNIKTSKRDELLNQIISDKKLKLIAVAGTHGKTTTTAMVIWLFKQLNLPLSYSVGAKIPFGDMGQYQDGSEYFAYECDEFDRNFLAFEPYLSLITGVTWDHHEVFLTREDYIEAFEDFLGQSVLSYMWKRDQEYMQINPDSYHHLQILDPDATEITALKLSGQSSREDAWLAIQGTAELTKQPTEKLIGIMNNFPGLQRRMEEIVPGLYSDYAHTPEKIRGAMSVALEMAAKQKKDVIVIYEPLTNRRQHYMINDYKDCFMGAKKIYWIPSYLAREDPEQRIITPGEMITHLSDPSLAEAGERNETLKHTIQKHLDQGDMVIAMAGGGGDSLDEWVRENFANGSLTE